MKKYYILKVLVINMLLGVGLFTSCVDEFKVGDAFLEKAPGVSVNVDSIFGRAEYARAYLWEVYGKLYHPYNSNFKYNIGDVPLDGLSDLIQSRLGWGDMRDVWYPGNYNASFASDYVRDRLDYTRIWAPVRNCWNFIENIDRVPDMTVDEKERLKAESKIMISTFYYSLFKQVGGLPIIDHAYSTTEPYNAPRASVEATVDFMVNLLDEAAATPSLPFSIAESDQGQWAGRLTKGSALGFKAKVLLYAASPLFNSDQPYSTQPPQIAVDSLQVWYGGYKAELWQRCLEACEDFFQENQTHGNPFALLQPAENTEAAYMSNYRDAYWNRGNSEKIIEVHTVTYHTEWGDQLPVNVAHQGAMCPPLNLWKCFLWQTENRLLV